MHWLSSPLDRLRDGAWDLACRDWPIAPAHYVVTPGRHRLHGRHRPPGNACSCRDVRCTQPGAHPVSQEWRNEATVDSYTLGYWWGGAQPWNIVLPTGWRFDVWRAPTEVAASALEILRRGSQPIGPVAHTPSGDLLFFTAARFGEPPIELPHTVAVGYHGAGDYVLAPPSRLSGAQVRWLRPPAPDNPPLPRWEPVAEALLRSSRHCQLSAPRAVLPVVPIRRAG